MHNPSPNPFISAVATPPIAEVASWVEGRIFSDDKPLLDVCQAVPSYSPPEALFAHLAEHLREPATSTYTDITGLPLLSRALARHLSTDYQGMVEGGQIAITAGCNQAFCVAMDVLAGPGDEVILPLPYYFNHRMWLDMRGITTVHPPFEEGLPRVEAIDSSITPRTRAIAIVTPNNPTGLEFPPGLIESFFELAREHSIALVIDETYKDFRSTQGPPHNLFKRADWTDALVHLFSFSKSYAMTGYRVGALVTASPLIAEATKVLDCLNVSASHVGQLAALYALENLADWRDGKIALMRSRVAALRDAFHSNCLTYELVSTGAYFAYVRHPFEDTDATSVARWLSDEHNILCLPGSMFGSGQERYLRFAFANLDATQMSTLVERLIQSQ